MKPKILPPNRSAVLLAFAIVVLSGHQPPDWAKDAIWYQIFPERFSNGDPSNDPTIETLQGTWPYDKQTQWKISSWTGDWYKLQPWEVQNQKGFYYNAQLRRYGGDIQGILDKLDYLQDIGVNAIYLNPLFESPSSHKYGCAMWRHIDNNFGPDPQGDERIWTTENPEDPSTWKWTSADRLFLTLVEQVHARDMRIIIDGVFNHVGIGFWAFQDVKKWGRQSPYSDWFVIKAFDDPTTEEDEFDYQGWYGVPDLPEIMEDDMGPHPAVRNHIHQIVKRWMDPNGDGIPSDGIDGWRLDVAEMVSINFWKVFSEWVKTVNPDSYVTAEIWWEDYSNNIMYNASPWLGRDGFDAVMNYRFGDAMYKFFNNEKKQITASQLDELLASIREDYGPQHSFVLQNLMDSHDCERIASAVVNPDRWIDHGGNVQHNPDFQVRKPNQSERQKQKVMLAFQFAYVGAPYIYYGDEVGMWGADDPDCRKPMVWPELYYEDESNHPLGYPRNPDLVSVDSELVEYYRNLIRLRVEHPALRRGTYHTLLTDDENGIFAFLRQTEEERIVAVFNGSTRMYQVPASLLEGGSDRWTVLFGVSENPNVLHGKSAKIYIRD